LLPTEAITVTNPAIIIMSKYSPAHAQVLRSWDMGIKVHLFIT